MTTTHRITRTALLILSLAGTGAPAVSAMPARSEPAGAPNPAPVAAYSRQDKSMIPATTPDRGHVATQAGGHVSASTAAQASADRIAAERAAASPSAPLDRFALANVHRVTPTTSGPRSEVVSGGGYSPGTPAPTVVRVVDGDSGFDWIDAAIGAAGGITLSMLGLGGAHGVSQYRTRTRNTAALSG